MQLELNTVDERLVGCFNDVFGNTYSSPAALFVTRFYQNPDSRGCSLTGRKHTHLVVKELDILKFGIELLQRLTECVVKGIYRAIPFGCGMFDLPPRPLPLP